MIGKTEMIEGPKEPFSTAVACKHPSRPVSAIGSRSKPNDKDPGAGIAEAGEGFCPVIPVPESSGLMFGEFLKIGNEPWAPPASDYSILEFFQFRHTYI